ncbi:uncharacterized protein LOC129612532 [Condylostylus longicornis]|uniref:uncharacterized protein LOC129612532 n=1 Tax=Condylostylus longicornis TaxID=2530218 RepID=UPI00244DBE26|nr:uncharacterized protein LOC129612532 [Condylostylus longicornis]
MLLYICQNSLIISIKFNKIGEFDIEKTRDRFQESILNAKNEIKKHFKNILRHVKGQFGYLVYENNCKIPNVDAFDPTIMRHFEKRVYQNCTKNETLTFVTFNSNSLKYELHFDKSKLNSNESFKDWDCCYKEIMRQDGSNPDGSYKTSNCNPYNETTIELDSSIDFITVKCINSQNNKTYSNGHAMIPEKVEVRNRFNTYDKVYNKHISVFLIGIDSMSRANLIRSMPNTAEFLYGQDQQWFDMQGYNKVGDNTLPNLMPLLTGYNLTSRESCYSTENGSDNCPLIWKLFEKYGYATIYAEDWPAASTFNYLQRGFIKKPVDFYLRPFTKAIRDELIVEKHRMQSTCIGSKHESEYILEYGLEFLKRLKGNSYFGLLWLNTFSHDGFDLSSEMDMKMLEYFEKLKNIGIMDESIIFFLSDHGMRWGSGNNFYEERLPFLYIWLPSWFKKEYSDIVKSITINQNRLINPYDVHMTLKHIIKLSGRIEDGIKIEQAKDCLKCQSLFIEVSSNRTCSEIEIEDHWCTCDPFEMIDTNDEFLTKLGNFVVQYINNLIAKHDNSTVKELCRTDIKLNKINEAFYILPSNTYSSDVKRFRIAFSTEAVGHKDNGKFFATVHINSKTGDVDIKGDISRLNKYADDASCIDVQNAKKFCFCYINNGTKH